MEGLGTRVWGFGSRLWGEGGFRVSGVGSMRVSGLGDGVWEAFGSRVWGLGFGGCVEAGAAQRSAAQGVEGSPHDCLLRRAPTRWSHSRAKRGQLKCV